MKNQPLPDQTVIAKINYKGILLWIKIKNNEIIQSSFKNIFNKNYKKIKLSKDKESALIKCIKNNTIKNRIFKFKLKGTAFQIKVWNEILKIPFGKTISYKIIAENIKNKKSVRAAANACGANNLPLFIPCHRVIKSDGTIGGFSSPVRIKKKLLRLEGVII